MIKLTKQCFNFISTILFTFNKTGKVSRVIRVFFSPENAGQVAMVAGRVNSMNHLPYRASGSKNIFQSLNKLQASVTIDVKYISLN